MVGGKRRKVISPYYRAAYNDMVGRPQNVALKLPSGSGVTDKDVARKLLDEILIRQQREAVGLRDASIDSACLPIRKVLADFLRHLRRNGRTPKHVRRNAHDVLRLCELMGATRLGEVNAVGIDVAIGRLGETGIGPKTVNAYRDCLHAMLDWAVRVARLLPVNPAEMVVRLSQGDDVRKVRRAMPPDQARALLAVADEFGRGLVYRAAMLTGLRWSELAALEWRDLDLDDERPSLTLRAGTTKSRRGDTLPINPELAALLRAERKPDDSPTDRVLRVPRLDTFRRDCVRAGIPGFVWNAEKGRALQIPDDRGRTLDFHALRTTYVSWLSAAGVAPRTAQMLARHTDIRLTMRSYTDPRLLDGHAAVESLPDLQPDQPTTETAKATGTNGPISEVNCNVDCNGQDVSESKPLRIQGSDDWRRRESNPRPKALQERLLRA